MLDCPLDELLLPHPATTDKPVASTTAVVAMRLRGLTGETVAGAVRRDPAQAVVA